MKAQLYSFNYNRLLDDWHEAHVSQSLNKLLNDAAMNNDLTDTNKIRKYFLQCTVGQHFLTLLNQLLTLDNQLLR